MLEFYRTFSKTIHRLAIYLGLIVVGGGVASLKWLLDDEGNMVRHPSLVWWVVTCLEIAYNCLIALRAMMDGSAERERSAAAAAKQ